MYETDCESEQKKNRRCEKNASISEYLVSPYKYTKRAALRTFLGILCNVSPQHGELYKVSASTAAFTARRMQLLDVVFRRLGTRQERWQCDDALRFGIIRSYPANYNRNWRNQRTKAWVWGTLKHVLSSFRTLDISRGWRLAERLAWKMKIRPFLSFCFLLLIAFYWHDTLSGEKKKRGKSIF